MKIFRWKAVVPLALFLLLVALVWTLYVDRLIRLAIEEAGAEVVGAKVDVASARLRLMHGDLVLNGLAVTNPEAPMKKLAFSRVGDSIAARWRVRSDSVGWSRLGDTVIGTGPSPRIGTKAWADALLWRSASSLRGVEIEARMSGRMASPRVAVSSNVGDELAPSLQGEIGAEVSRAEARARAEVDRLVQERVREARAKLVALESGVQARVNDGRARLEAAQADLEQRVRELGRGIPGVRFP